MKKIVLILFIALTTVSAMAQQQLAFPFQGGNAVMSKFFRDSLEVSPEINKAKASGTVIFKFTADEKGTIQKIIVYYADDAILVKPIIEVLRKSNHKWVIPFKEKAHDFILPFSISFNAPATGADKAQKDLYSFYNRRQPIVSYDQVPLDMATLLPAVVIKYDLK